MFGILPAYGFYCRHVKGLHFNNVRVQTIQPDARPALVMDDVENASIDGHDTEAKEGTVRSLQKTTGF